MYPGHEEDKWYGITQYLIWNTVDKDANIYFSDERYGVKVERYTEEINEIEKLIIDYKKLQTYDNKTYQFFVCSLKLPAKLL